MSELPVEGREADERMCGDEIRRHFGGRMPLPSDGFVNSWGVGRPIVNLIARFWWSGALAEVTDQLMSAGWAAAEGRLDAARSILQLLRERHESVACGLVGGNEYDVLRGEFGGQFDVWRRC